LRSTLGPSALRTASPSATARSIAAAFRAAADEGRRLQRGHDADLIAFDPDVLSDHATYQRPARASVAMRHVISAVCR
jgi:hypothetical protein